jgi:hypothetical protein
MGGVRGTFEDCERFAVGAKGGWEGGGLEFEGLNEGCEPELIGLYCFCWLLSAFSFRFSENGTDCSFRGLLGSISSARVYTLPYVSSASGYWVLGGANAFCTFHSDS